MQRRGDNVVNKRNDIYVIKAMGIILVVYMHSFLFLYSEWDHMTNIIIQWIESFFMPLFFIACGMGMKDRYEVIISFSNIKVMVVYVIWAFIYLNNRDIHSYFGILYGTNKVLGVIGTNAVLWFIPTFVLASMIYKTILKFSTSDVLYSALVCGCVCVGFLGGGIPEIQM